MQAPDKKTKYCGCLYLEAGMHILLMLTFLSLGLSLICMPKATPFSIIYLVNIVGFIFITFCNEKVWTRLAFYVFFILGTIAEFVCGIVITV